MAWIYILIDKLGKGNAPGTLLLGYCLYNYKL